MLSGENAGESRAEDEQTARTRSKVWWSLYAVGVVLICQFFGQDARFHRIPVPVADVRQSIAAKQSR